MKIEFSTSHGGYNIVNWNVTQTLEELCVLNRIPYQSASFYGESEEGLDLIIGLHHPISHLMKSYNKILIKPDRNIDYKSCSKRHMKIKTVPNPVSEYTFPASEGNELLHFEFSQLSCQEYVTKEVFKFLKNEVSLNPNRKIVLGVSGGGDSNTLIMSFLESGLVARENLIAVMMLGIPDWDRGKVRAQEICQKHQVELRFVDAEKVNGLLGRSSRRDWVEDFEEVFPDADLEVLGTHCIRLALKSVAQESNAQAVVTGLNLEDILAECFLATMKGMLPPPFPVRPVDGTSFWHPLYRIPKKIIDGCYPKLSLENYNERYPSRMLGRAIPYYVSQSMHGILPGIEFDLLRGFQKLSQTHRSFGFFDEKLGFSTVEPIPDILRRKWEAFTK